MAWQCHNDTASPPQIHTNRGGNLSSQSVSLGSVWEAPRDKRTACEVRHSCSNMDLMVSSPARLITLI